MAEDDNLLGQYAVLKYGRTYYELQGPEDGEAIVCMHGITLFSFIYSSFTKDMLSRNAGFRVLTFDFYGRGHSDSAGVENNAELFVEQAHELTEKLGIHKMHVIGLSMGGAVAGVFAATYPEKVDKLVLISPAVAPVDVPFVGRLVTYPFVGAAIFKLVGAQMMLSRLQSDRLKEDFLHPERVPEVVASCVSKALWQLQSSDGFIQSFHSTLCNFPLASGVLHFLERLDPRIKALVVWGEGDEVTPVRCAPLVMAALHRAKVQATLLSIPDTGHMCILETPEPVHKGIFDFLSHKDEQAQL